MQNKTKKIPAKSSPGASSILVSAEAQPCAGACPCRQLWRGSSVGQQSCSSLSFLPVLPSPLLYGVNFIFSSRGLGTAS